MDAYGCNGGYVHGEGGGNKTKKSLNGRTDDVFGCVVMVKKCIMFEKMIVMV